MKVNVNAVNFSVDRKLVVFIQERLTKLEKYYDKVVSADVFPNRNHNASFLGDVLQQLIRLSKEPQ